MFGGTFDPPHWGHVRAAEAVRDQLGVEEVWFVPAAVPPHRETPPRVAAGERLALVREAIRGRERLVASSIELEREGPSFTIDTLDQIAARRPPGPEGDARVIFVAGSDAFAEIRTWSRYRELLERHPVVVVSRCGAPLAEALAAAPEEFLGRVTDNPETRLVPPRIIALEIPLPDPASKDIRDRVGARLPVGSMMPSAVSSRIGERGYYR